MLRIAPFAEHPELVAALANALAHHGAGAPPEDAVGNLADFDNSPPDTDR
jgi:hypothetical protein